MSEQLFFNALNTCGFAGAIGFVYRAAVAISKGAWLTPGIRGSNPFRWMVLLAVSESAPMVLPWNPPKNEMICFRLV